MDGLAMSQLRSILHLYPEKQQLLKELTGNLKPNDVKEDAAFQKTSERIKKAILLTPVTFGEPKILDHRIEEKHSPGNYQNPFPHKRQVTIVEVRFPFTGSEELFRHSPSAFSLTSSDTVVYQPDYDDSITVEAEIDKLDRDLALAKAKQMMTTTFSLVRQINPQAEGFTKNTEPHIDSLLAKRRDEVLNFYK